MEIATPTVELAANLIGAEIDARMQRLAVLYGTRAGEQAGDRSFGLSWEAVDMPPIAARAAMENEITSKTNKYLPDCVIDRIDWDIDALHGQMIPRVVVHFV